MKRRLFSPCCVAAPCPIPHRAAGLRLAWQKNPSVSFVPLFPIRDTSKLLLEQIGLNIGNIVLTKLFGDKQVPLNCLAADFTVTNGVMQE